MPKLSLKNVRLSFPSLFHKATFEGVETKYEPLTEDDNRIYSGCYVNASVELWYQKNAYGKRVNANLLGIQFFKDGEAFGEGGTTASGDDFDAFDDDDEDIFG